MEKKEKKNSQNNTENASKEDGGVFLDPEVAELTEDEEAAIPDIVAEDPALEEPAEQIVAIHFHPLSLNHTEVDRMDKGDAKALVHKLFEANTTKKSHAQNNGLIRDKVNNTGPYRFLYRNLSPDVEVLEIKFRREGRIFGYWVENSFNILAVRTNHL